MVFPTQQVSSVIVRVLFPTLVQIRDDLPRLRAAYLRSVGGIALVTFPMMGGLFAVAADFVTVVFGSNWAPMIPLIQVLAWVGMLQSVSTTVGAIYLSMGRTDVAFRVTAIGTPIIIGGMAGGLPWGIVGVAYGYAMASFTLFFYVTIQALKLIDLKLPDFVRLTFRPMLATLGMVALVELVVVLTSAFQPAVRLAIGVCTGIVAYIALSLAVNRRQLIELWELAAAARARQR
jgi:PST family polysaccharide transporter